MYWNCKCKGVAKQDGSRRSKSGFVKRHYSCGRCGAGITTHEKVVIPSGGRPKKTESPS